jgi:large subunit ribosomal protein L13
LLVKNGLSMSTKTFHADPDDRRWFIVDAEGKTLGRLASRVATILRGKHKPVYSPHLDHGDNVVIVNAEKVGLTGRKLETKTYFRYTGYMSGGRTTTIRELLASKPTQVMRKAVWGMMPKNRLGRSMFTKLKIYAGPKHPHESQDPQPLPPDKAKV